jgi:hypothetical protein
LLVARQPVPRRQCRDQGLLQHGLHGERRLVDGPAHESHVQRFPEHAPICAAGVISCSRTSTREPLPKRADDIGQGGAEQDRT